MVRNDDIQVEGTTNDYLVQKLADEEHGQEFTEEYLKAEFLSSAANTLFSIRHQAGLTQAQVAERLNTKQSAIARLEADFDGPMSLRRYAEFALACGVILHDITFVPIEAARAFVIAQPDTPFTQENHHSWLKVTFQLTPQRAGNRFQPTMPIPLSATTLKEAEPKLNIMQAQSLPFQLQRSADTTTVTQIQSSQVSQLNSASQKAA